MPVNYSKWDNLELSDDSDIEVHPNVDKRSFIRAKQHQIHQQRQERRHHIETLKYERIINDGLLSRIDKLVEALQQHASSSRNPDELVFEALMETTSAFQNDEPPPRPEGVHARVQEQPTYSKMMAALVDQVKKEVDESKAETRLEKYVEVLQGHQTKVRNLQEGLQKELAELELEESKKITSDSIHTGFDSSHVAKSNNKKSDKDTKSQSVELLNPGSLEMNSLSITNKPSSEPADSGGASKEDDADEEDVKVSKLGKEFAQIKIGDYGALLQYISQHPSVVAERETDGLLVEAFDSQLAGKDEYAKRCVHHALLLQYCRTLGRDGVGLFFKRITTPGHQAQKIFLDDVNSTYARIRTRAYELAAERAAGDGGTSEGVEQIQLHAVDPGKTINIVVPQRNSEDEVERKAREIFEKFPTDLQRALEAGSLDEVNKVLAKMSVEEAEAVVGQLSEGGMLSLDDEIIDATTEEGQEKWKEIEAQKGGKTEEVEGIGDPD